MFNTLHQQEMAVLRSQIDRLVRERKVLVQVAGAAALLVRELDDDTFETYEAAGLLAEYLRQVDKNIVHAALAP